MSEALPFRDAFEFQKSSQNVRASHATTEHGSQDMAVDTFHLTRRCPHCSTRPGCWWSRQDRGAGGGTSPAAARGRCAAAAARWAPGVGMFVLWECQHRQLIPPSQTRFFFTCYLLYLLEGGGPRREKYCKKKKKKLKHQITSAKVDKKKLGSQQQFCFRNLPALGRSSVRTLPRPAGRRGPSRGWNPPCSRSP